MHDITVVSSTVGGILIGASAVILMLAAGRIAGISGIVARLLPPWVADHQGLGRLAFVAGLVAGPHVVRLLASSSGSDLAAPAPSAATPAVLIMAGLLVGFGSVLGSGCTSGHGVCGLARLSPRSILATAIFLSAGVATVYFTRHVVGG